MKRVKLLQPLTLSLPKGVGRDGDYLTFPATETEDQIRETLKRMTGEAGKVSLLQKAYTPTDEDRALISQRVKSGVDTANFGIYRTVASSTRIDSDRDKFGISVLGKMAEHYKEGRTVVIEDHSGQKGVGKTFDAEVITAPDGESELLVKFYIDDQLNASTGNAKRLLDSGVFDRVSIKAFLRMTGYMESENSPDGRGYWLWDSPETVQTLHLAIVDYGANPDAKFKSVGGKSENPLPGIFGEIETTVKKMKYTLKSLNQDVEVTDELKPVLEQLDTRVTSLTESLKKYQDAEAAKLQALRDDYLNKQQTLHPTATEPEKERWKKMAAVYTAELLESEISVLDVQVKNLKTAGNLKPETGKTETAQSAAKSIFQNYQ